MAARTLVLLTVVSMVAFGAPAAADLAPSEDAPHVLMFTGTWGFRHGSIETSQRVVRELADQTGAFTVTVTEDIAAFTPQMFATTDVILFSNTTGEIPFTPEQRQMFVDYLECGGGFAGIHAAADTNYEWPEYQELVGAAFESHPHTGNRLPLILGGQLFDQASVIVEDQAHPINEPWHGEDSFPLREEYYKWRENPRDTQDVEVLLSLDETTTYAGGLRYGAGDYEPRQPLAWVKSFRGHNRVWYTNLGHYDGTYERADWQQSFVNAVGWLSELGADSRCLAAAGISS